METGLLTYLSACMAHDKLFGLTAESEAITFSRFLYIITELDQVNISWSFYALEHYYDTITREWKRGDHNIKNQALNMPRNLENIYEVIPK